MLSGGQVDMCRNIPTNSTDFVNLQNVLYVAVTVLYVAYDCLISGRDCLICGIRNGRWTCAGTSRPTPPTSSTFRRTPSAGPVYPPRCFLCARYPYTDFVNLQKNPERWTGLPPPPYEP